MEASYGPAAAFVWEHLTTSEWLATEILMEASYGPTAATVQRPWQTCDNCGPDVPITTMTQAYSPCNDCGASVPALAKELDNWPTLCIA